MSRDAKLKVVIDKGHSGFGRVEVLSAGELSCRSVAIEVDARSDRPVLKIETFLDCHEIEMVERSFWRIIRGAGLSALGYDVEGFRIHEPPPIDDLALEYRLTADWLRDNVRYGCKLVYSTRTDHSVNLICEAFALAVKNATPVNIWVPDMATVIIVNDEIHLCSDKRFNTLQNRQAAYLEEIEREEV